VSGRPPEDENVWFKRIGLFLVVNLLIILTVGIVSALLGVGGYRVGGSLNYGQLMAYCAVWGFVGAFVSLGLSRIMAKMMMGVKVINPQSATGVERTLLERVHRLATAAGLPMPEVGIYESPEINAFATGPTKKRSLVAVSSGLLQRMSDAEVEGVLAHEVAHIANGDMVTLTLVQGVVNSFVLFFAKIVGFFAGQAVEERNRFMVEMIVTIAAQIIFGILGTVVVAWFSRAREYRADAGGARLAGRDKMIAALDALRRSTQSLETHTPEAVAAFKISSRPSGFAAMFSTHPPLEDRIRALQTQVF
jgi:heat shock protein HtpX